MSDSVNTDTSDASLRVSEEISKRCGRKVEFSEMYWREGEGPKRDIYVDGQRMRLSSPVVMDPNSDSIEDAFIYSITEAIRKQTNAR